MVDHIANRRKIINSLREELFGPSPQGKEINCNQDINFAEPGESYGPWRQAGTGEEILHRDPPTKRYGIGVLYPQGVDNDQSLDKTENIEEASNIEIIDEETPDLNFEEQRIESIEEIAGRAERKGGSGERETNDFDLTTANSYKPSSMAISFLAYIPKDSEMLVEARGGRYFDKKVHIAGKERLWWLRKEVSLSTRFNEAGITSANNSTVLPFEEPTTINTKDLELNIEVFARPYQNTGNYLLTVCLINRKKSPASANLHSLFQSYFKVSITSESGKACILPYPGPPAEKLDLEEQSLALLYRKTETFAVGHGCAASWEDDKDLRKVSWVSAECLPETETPSITSDITRDDGTLVSVSMATLAGLVPSDDGFSSLADVIELYKSWIEKQKSEINSLAANFQEAANNHITECLACYERMEKGLNYLKNNPVAYKAFQLANHAILLQQVRSRREPRKVQFNTKTKFLDFTPIYSDTDPLNPPPNRGSWRAFQIAFLLMCVQSAAESDVPDRKTVELIWFPTGGGKTEAYLGLAAYSTFIRRLKNPNDSGVNTLMRYTLRLLTAQQFQRASGLLCAMEHLRRRENKENPSQPLGSEPLSIGIWLGGTTTPNTREKAIKTLKSLNKGDRFTENLFVLSRCPWCGAQMGVIKYEGKKPSGAPRVLGYEESANTVVFKCPDSYCEFTNGIPVYVIDDDIYEKRPSLVIGTVDKFAMLAWRPGARSLFGFDANGDRDCSPPGLIIQDELHLISGPLGSMVGLYETVIEELCTDRRGDTPVPPKIVSSTATIRRYKEQIKALYARDQVTLFPPPGLDANESFFATNARDNQGNLKPGRIYVGVHAPGLGSLQTTQVRTFSALLQAPVALSKEERDPWWTLLLFFNSLRELGTTLSLFQSDIPDYFRVLLNRTSLSPNELRNFWNIKELTGRLRSEEVPEAISSLEVICTNPTEDPVDVCLASNIIEVGVDIDRLSLMAVVGQPKTTSQYIQVTGRVGRQWYERPGLVVTIYGASKPRDRSHFEKFRTYHERLYAQVEPTSVTPFSPPVLDRALHAVMTIYARQQGNNELAASPFPYPIEMINDLRDILLPRVKIVDKDEQANFERVFDKRSKQWEKWERVRWSSDWDEADIPLLRQPGAYISSDKAKISWATPQSLRNVDAECQIEITQLYINQEGDNA